MALASSAYDAGIPAEPVSSVAEALEAIRSRTKAKAIAPRILIGGSLYVVGNVLADNGTPPK